MTLTVIDYSEVYFALVNDIPVPAKRAGKFVIMTKGDERYAVFSPRGLSAYHANIIERFLRQQGIRGQYNEKGDRFRFASRDWRVEGGGCWELDESGGTLRLSGHSESYGSVDLKRLADELRGTDTFRQVRVEGIKRSSVL